LNTFPHVPDELLDPIVSIVSADNAAETQTNMLHLCLTSRRLYRIAKPYLYRTVWFGQSNFPYFVQFLTNIIERPELARSIRVLHIWYNANDPYKQVIRGSWNVQKMQAAAREVIGPLHLGWSRVWDVAFNLVANIETPEFEWSSPLLIPMLREGLDPFIPLVVALAEAVEELAILTAEPRQLSHLRLIDMLFETSVGLTLGSWFLPKLKLLSVGCEQLHTGREATLLGEAYVLRSL